MDALLARHGAVRTEDPPAMLRADQLMVAERDRTTLPATLTRWLADPHPPVAGVHRWPLRTGTGADVRSLLADLGDRDRHGTAAPVHLLRAAPRWRGGPADDPTPTADPAPAPAPADPFAAEVTVAVLDTGITAHPWFTERSWWVEVTADQREVLDADGDGLPDHQAGHGTFVTGVLLHQAPSAHLMVRRLLSGDGVCDEVHLIEALAALRAEAAGTGRRVDLVNLSFGCHTYDDRPSALVSEAVAALGRRTVLVAAAGNAHTDRPFWPAALKNVLAVGALDAAGRQRAAFSNHAWWIEACAIGQEVHSAFPLPDGTAGFARWSGTSFAAPVITGTIARLAADRGIDVAAAADLVLDPTARHVPGLGIVIG
ncbi:MAG TPA: S8/S53 family peptidase [Sporichthyaceae bacterium]|jgi:subtilisin family serine protease